MLTLRETATRVGHYAWFERRLFEVAGGWVPSVPAANDAECEAKLHLASQADHHAWHAALWLERLPELREIDPASLTVAPSPQLAAFLDQLGAEDATIARMVGLTRVATVRLLVALEGHLAVVAPLGDRALTRTLRIVRTDLLEDWLAGERIISRLAAGDSGSEAMSAAQTAFERAAGRGSGLA